MNGDLISLDDLPRLAKAARDADSKTRALIAADATVTSGRVLEIMDRLRQAGIHTIAFGVQAKP